MVASWEVVLAGNRTPLGPLAIDLGPAAPTAPASNFSVTLACQEAAGGPAHWRPVALSVREFRDHCLWAACFHMKLTYVISLIRGF